MSDIEGIPQEKLDRLWMHLEKVEELTGSKLRKTPRCYLADCPIENFAPTKDKNGDRFWGQGSVNSYYGGHTSYQAYDYSDSEWWKNLPDKTHRQINKWVMKKIKKRNKTV